MTYKALYRKWRPIRFDQVAGQSHITTTLKSEIMEDKVGHAYLFCGSHGTGKTTCAKILAKAVNCLTPKNGEPCGNCDNCLKVAEGAFDIIEIDAASNNGVDNIRELRDEVIYTPAALTKKVYIIDEVHMLSTGAFNALLKTLEEPPSHVLFILATTEQHKIPATILSRCQRFDFKRISRGNIVAYLRNIAETEGFEADDDALTLIAQLSGGAMRNAIGLLDQCSGEQVTAERVRDLVGICGNESLYALAQTIADGDVPACLDVVQTLYDDSRDMAGICGSLASLFRDLMILQSGASKDLLQDQASQVSELSKQFTMAQILVILGELQSAANTFAKITDKRLHLEMTLIRLTNPALSAGNAGDDQTQARLDQLERRITSSVTPTTPKFTDVGAGLPPQGSSTRPLAETESVGRDVPPAEIDLGTPATESSPPSVSSTPPQTPSVDIDPAFWQKTLEALKSDPMLTPFLRGSTAIVQDNALVLTPADESYSDLLMSNKNQILSAAAPFTSEGLHLKIESPAQLALDEPEDDPLMALLADNQDDIELV